MSQRCPSRMVAATIPRNRGPTRAEAPSTRRLAAVSPPRGQSGWRWWRFRGIVAPRGPKRPQHADSRRSRRHGDSPVGAGGDSAESWSHAGAAASPPPHRSGRPRRRFRGIVAPTWDRTDLDMRTHRNTAATALARAGLGDDSAESGFHVGPRRPRHAHSPHLAITAPVRSASDDSAESRDAVRCAQLLFFPKPKINSGKEHRSGHWAVSGRALRTPCWSCAAGHRPACALPRSLLLRAVRALVCGDRACRDSRRSSVERVAIKRCR